MAHGRELRTYPRLVTLRRGWGDSVRRVRSGLCRGCHDFSRRGGSFFFLSPCFAPNRPGYDQLRKYRRLHWLRLIGSNASDTFSARWMTGQMGKGTFDLVANFYPWLEQMVFGSALGRSRNFFAQRIAEGKKILLIGEGNGRFLVEIAKQTSSASFTVVDSSARMLADSARRL